MKKILVLGIFAAIFGLVGFSFAQEDSFKESWKLPKTNFSNFEEIFIFTIDLKGMGVQKIDADNETVFEPVDDFALETIAHSINGIFAEKLDKVIPVNKEEAQIKSKKQLRGTKSLIVDLKLSYGLAIREKRALMSLLTGKAETRLSPPLMTFECTLTDSESQKVIVSFLDTAEVTVANNDNPFSGEEDQAKLIQLANVWADRLSKILFEKI